MILENVNTVRVQLAMTKYNFESPDMTVSKFVNDVLPTTGARLEDRWVLNEDGLPPEGVTVLCWGGYFPFGSYERKYRFSTGYQYGGNWNGDVTTKICADVIAWMPLPKPPVEFE